MELTAASTALVVVDMQNSFLDPDGACALMGLNYKALAASIPGCTQLVEVARSHCIPVVFTRYVYHPDYSDGGIVIEQLLPALREMNALRSGTWDAEIITKLAPQPGEIVIDKNRPSAFYNTSLADVLNNLGIQSLIVCGVTTNVCVETTVRDAMQRDYRVWVVRDATAEFDVDRHEAALTALDWMFAQVVSLDQAVAAIPALGRQSHDLEQ